MVEGVEKARISKNDGSGSFDVGLHNRLDVAVEAKDHKRSVAALAIKRANKAAVEEKQARDALNDARARVKRCEVEWLKAKKRSAPAEHEKAGGALPLSELSEIGGRHASGPSQLLQHAH